MTCQREKELLEQIEQTGEMYKVSALQLIKAGNRISDLESLNGALCRDSAGFVQDRDALAARVEVMRDALSLYASEYNMYWRPGMMILEPIADNALALPDLSADILRARDARVLRDAVQKMRQITCDCGAPCDCFAQGSAIRRLMRMAEELEQKNG